MSSSSSATMHWLYQRFTALFMLPGVVWFVIQLFSVLRGCKTIIGVCSNIPSSIILFLFLSFSLYHGNLGIKTIIEDYVRNRAIRLCLYLVTNFIMLLTISFLLFSFIRLVR